MSPTITESLQMDFFRRENDTGREKNNGGVLRAKPDTQNINKTGLKESSPALWGLLNNTYDTFHCRGNERCISRSLH